MNKKLYELLMNTSLSYNFEGKKSFKRLSKSFLKELSTRLNPKDCKISFNEGGIAVSGDATLMCMITEDKGIYININQSMGSPRFLYRTISHMKDYTGGHNNYISPSKMNDIDFVEKAIKSLL